MGKSLAILVLTEPLNKKEKMRKTYPAMIEKVGLKGKELEFVERCRWGMKLEDVDG